MTTHGFEHSERYQATSSTGPSFAVSRESIRLFCDGSLDYNPLHLDDDYMKGSFGKTKFGGIIMHGMNNFGLITPHAHRLGLSRRRGPSPAGDPLAEAGAAGRHHPARRYRQGKADDAIARAGF